MVEVWLGLKHHLTSLLSSRHNYYGCWRILSLERKRVACCFGSPAELTDAVVPVVLHRTYQRPQCPCQLRLSGTRADGA